MDANANTRINKMNKAIFGFWQKDINVNNKNLHCIKYSVNYVKASEKYRCYNNKQEIKYKKYFYIQLTL